MERSKAAMLKILRSQWKEYDLKSDSLVFKSDLVSMSNTILIS